MKKNCCWVYCKQSHIVNSHIRDKVKVELDLSRIRLQVIINLI